MEEKNQQPGEIVKDIKQLMERSSRFISLSGLSGIAAGICALAGALVACIMLDGMQEKTNYSGKFRLSSPEDALILKLLGVSVVTFILAFVSAFFFTWRKAKKQKLPVWDYTSRRLCWNMAIPVVAGGLFILGMLNYGEWRFIAPSCLIFYGLALVNASKYTLTDIRYLGYCEIVLGLASIFFIGYGLYFWAFGFGVLHIFYGAIMWAKYERNQ